MLLTKEQVHAKLPLLFVNVLDLIINSYDKTAEKQEHIASCSGSI